MPWGDANPTAVIALLMIFGNGRIFGNGCIIIVGVFGWIILDSALKSHGNPYVRNDLIELKN